MLWRSMLLYWFSMSVTWAQISVQDSSDDESAASAPPVDCEGELSEIITVLLLDREHTDSLQLRDA